MQGIIASSYNRVASEVGGSTTVTYTASTLNIANPERGFYKHEETSGFSPDPLNSSSLTTLRTGAGKITLVLRLFYLDDFVSSVIDAGYLSDMQTDFDAIRTAKMKAIIRFAYSNGDDISPSAEDAAKAIILGHITQVASVLETNKDVIACIQAGFIGRYGEWFYTDHFGDAGTISVGEAADRVEVAQAMLDEFPVEIPIQVRTPRIKKNITGSETALSEGEAYLTTNKARLGHHNDAFASSSSNEGTYEDRTADMAYLATDCKYVPNGGESNTEDTAWTSCSVSTGELATLHFSYLNSGYHPQVLVQWDTEGCIEDIKMKLGYRFKLTTATFPDSASTNLPIDITIVNSGYANPYRERKTYIVLRDTTTDDEYTKLVDTDCRLWGVTENITDTISLSGIPTGEYDLFLSLPDSLNDIPEYAIQLANTGTWETLTGYNNLNHTITIS